MENTNTNNNNNEEVKPKRVYTEVGFIRIPSDSSLDFLVKGCWFHGCWLPYLITTMVLWLSLFMIVLVPPCLESAAENEGESISPLSVARGGSVAK
jgi:hypothetical protein